MESLQVLCLHLVAERMESLCCKDSSGNLRLQDGIYLPSQVCDAIMQRRQRFGLTHKFLTIFKDSSVTRLDTINFSYIKQFDIITSRSYIDCRDTTFHPLERDLVDLISHDLSEVNLLGIRLTKPVIEALAQHCHRLRSLHFKASSFTCLCGNITEPDDAPVKCCLRNYKVDFKNLQKLTLHEVGCHDGHHAQSFNIAVQIMLSTKHLSVLDLSKSLLMTLEFLLPQDFPHLQSLILFEVRINHASGEESPLAAPEFKTISKFTNLRKLDVSRVCEYAADADITPEVKRVFEDMIHSLSQLEWLDISGTAFAGDASNECAISWLKNRHLRFLGLLDCKNTPAPSKRANIPADNVAGLADLDQILTSLQTYATRAWVPYIFEPLKALIHYLLPPNQKRQKSVLQRALKVVVEVMEANLHEGRILAAGCQCLTVLMGLVDLTEDIATKRCIIRLVVDIIHLKNSLELFRCAGDVLDRFRLPKEGLFMFERLAGAMLRILRLALSHQNEWFDYSYMMSQFESIAHPLAPEHKKVIGQLGGIKLLNQVISYEIRTMTGGHQTPLTIAWQLLYSLTDETPENASSFIEESGLELFVACHRLVKNEHMRVDMMGLMGNITEVADLRPRIMNSQVMDILVMSIHKGYFEMQNSVFCALAHMIADGEECWTYKAHSRGHVDNLIKEEVERWDQKRFRSVEYRTLKPLVRLLQCEDSLGVMTYGAWEVLNVTHGKSNRYLPMLEKDGMVEALQHLLRVVDQASKAWQFADLLLNVHNDYRERKCKPKEKKPTLTQMLLCGLSRGPEAELLNDDDDSDYQPHISDSEESESENEDGEDDDQQQHEALIDLLEGNLVQQALEQLEQYAPADFDDSSSDQELSDEVIVPDVDALLQQQHQLNHLEYDSDMDDAATLYVTDEEDNDSDNELLFLGPPDEDDPDYFP